MRLSALTSLPLHGPDVEITGITADSREVTPGCLFIAIPGTRHNGTAFIAEAVQKGAVAVLMPLHTPLPQAGGVGGRLPTTLITTDDVRIATAGIASAFYPKQPDTIVAVTGTSGKTSTAQFTRELWQNLGHTSASIGTLGLITRDKNRYGSLTTPDAITLHKLLQECTTDGVTHLAMEASSHGLALHRLDHVRLKAGGFTNLTRDHLDYHKTMEEYFAAKQRLFSEILPADATAVLNADSDASATLAAIAKKRGLKVLLYGKKTNDLKLIDVLPHAQGQLLKVELFGKKRDINLPVIGSFQAHNALCALGMAVASGADPAKAAGALERVSGVPGRLQPAGVTAAGAAVFVDYAHKPDALENVLTALRPHAAAHKAKLGVVFGCGGNRDAGKRPIMGEIAARLADWVIVTDDNPRHEQPAAIRAAVLAGCAANPNVQEIGDRATAISTAITRLKSGDVLIIAGKGHEHGQIVGDNTLPFDDTEVAQRFLG